MPEGTLQLPVDGTGKSLRTVTNPAVAGGAHQEVVSLAGADGTLLDPATQTTLAAVLARLLATLSVGGTVTVANPTAAGLTDGQLRAAAVPVSGFPASQAVSAAALPLPAGAATDATAANLLAGFLARYKAVTTAKATYTTSGNHTLITPPAGQSLRVVWLYAQAKAALDVGTVLVTFTLGSNSYEVELTGSQPFAHGAVWDGAVDQPLVVATSSTAAVLIDVDYRVF